MVVFTDSIEEKPACYSFADSSDPACGKCSLYEKCFRKAVKSRPPCFASYVDMDSACLMCLLRSMCKESTRVAKKGGKRKPITLEAQSKRLAKQLENSLKPKGKKRKKKVVVRRRK